jgi:hypothetical protein
MLVGFCSRWKKWPFPRHISQRSLPISSPWQTFLPEAAENEGQLYFKYLCSSQASYNITKTLLKPKAIMAINGRGVTVKKTLVWLASILLPRVL